VSRSSRILAKFIKIKVKDELNKSSDVIERKILPWKRNVQWL